MKVIMDEILPGFTRITTILAPFSGITHVNPDVLKNAADRGTRTHIACDCLIAGLGEWFEDDILGYVESFRKWFSNKTFIKKPSRMYCDEIMITGELDLIYEEDGDLVLVDLKTSSNPSKTWALQGTAYSYLAKKNGFENGFKRIEFIKLTKDGKDPKVFTYEEDMELFLKVLDTYRYFYEGKNKDLGPCLDCL